MSAAATRRFVASVSLDRTCACGETFTIRRHEHRILCMSCIADAAERAAQRLEVIAARRAAAKELHAATHCDDCGTQLLTPAVLCGLCDPDYDLGAALARLDSDEASPNGRKPR